jgi:hypothetical protein
MENIVEEHISGEELLAMAVQILGDENRYEDSLMEISRQGDYIEVTRKPMTKVAGWLRGENPVTMAEKGRVFRHHGEHSFLTKHMRKLCSESEN